MRWKHGLLCCLLFMLGAAQLTQAVHAATNHPAARITEKILYRFKGGADGANPLPGVVMDRAGDLYGTTSGMHLRKGPCKRCGTVFEISARMHVETVLHTFSGGADGAHPAAGVVVGRYGNLYGITEMGGRNCTTGYVFGCGTVFQVSPRNHAEIILHASSRAGGSWPQGGVILDAKGDIYGMTSTGLCPSGKYGCGTVFEIAAGSRKAIVLHTFSPGDHANGTPEHRLLIGRSGNLYGATWNLGAGRRDGTVFEITAGKHEFRILHSFTGGRDGIAPNGGLVMDRKGNLYGTTGWGGGWCINGRSAGDDALGCGTVFEIAAGTHRETILHHFKGGRGGMEPNGGLLLDSDGDLYGTTAGGGINCRRGCGIVFKVAAVTHKVTVLYRFKGGRDGEHPGGNLVMDKAGDLYGTTFDGGENCLSAFIPGRGCGTVFEIIRRTPRR